METDVLAAPYRRDTIELPDDFEGPLVATLVSRDDSPADAPAVLYVHGFSDYFFHPHVADFFLARGYAFYALDLRKAGRSLRQHQTAHFVRYIPEYFAEIDAATQLIRGRHGHDELVIYGHSTGALTASLWAHRMRRHEWLRGLILNSPFFAWNIPRSAQRLGIMPLDLAGLLAPRHPIPFNAASWNVESLHHTLRGEWEFDLEWKPVEGTTPRLGWLRAVDRAQRQVRRGVNLAIPVLALAATESFQGSEWSPQIHTADAVLNADDIARWAPRLGDDVTVVRIAGGRHDLALSQQPARRQFFAAIDDWLLARRLVTAG